MWDEIINGYGNEWKGKGWVGYEYSGGEFWEVSDVGEGWKGYLYEREGGRGEEVCKGLW